MADDIIREKVKTYFTLDKEIKESDLLLKDLKKKRKASGDDILHWMQENGRTRIKTKHGILERSVQTRKISVNAQWVHERAVEFMDEEQASNLCKLVFEQRPSEEKEILKTAKGEGGSSGGGARGRAGAAASSSAAAETTDLEL